MTRVFKGLIVPDTCYRRRGSSIVEGAVALSLLLVLLVVVVITGLEVSKGYMIWSTLQQCARQSARLLATTYLSHPDIATSLALQKQYGFDPIRVNQIVNSSDQFAATFEPAVGKPNSVTVTVTYLSGQHGLPKFPNTNILPLPANYLLQGTARYTVE